MYVYALAERRFTRAGLLREVPGEEGDEESQGDLYEEREASHPRSLPGLRHEDVPHRHSLITTYPSYPGRGIAFPSTWWGPTRQLSPHLVLY